MAFFYGNLLTVLVTLSTVLHVCFLNCFAACCSLLRQIIVENLLSDCSPEITQNFVERDCIIFLLENLK